MTPPRKEMMMDDRRDADLRQQDDDAWWARQAQAAERESFLGVEETARVLEALSQAKDAEAC